MSKKLLLAFLCWCSVFSFTFYSAEASTSKTIQFSNQKDEAFVLENFLKEIYYTNEVVDSTCYRDVSSVENVCRDQTRYREECSRVPGRQQCYNDYERVCRTETRYENVCRRERDERVCRSVTRYREECRGGGRGDRQCRTIPGDVRCRRMPNGDNRCEKVPPREECSEREERRECRQVPYQDQECHTIPGRQVCSTEPRYEQVCHNEPRQRCEWIPEQNVCRNVPYTVPVCGNETVWKKEPYACKETVKVPHERILKTHQADVLVEFSQTNFSPLMSFDFNLDTNGKLTSKAENQQDKLHLAIVKKDIQEIDSPEVNKIKAKYSITLFDLEKEFTATRDGIYDVELEKDSLKFKVNGLFNVKRSKMNLVITKKDETKFNKVLKNTQFRTEVVNGETIVKVDLESLGAPKLGGVFNRTHSVSIRFEVDYSDLGEVMNRVDPKLTISRSVEVKVE